VPRRRTRPSGRGPRLLHEAPVRARAGPSGPRAADGVPDETDPAVVRVARSALVAAVLTAQNAVIFFAHYVRSAGFPWDFGMSYYAMVAFWTTGVRLGTLPQWVPFQQMGYPFALQVQSGINYLPLWIFPVAGLSYTLHAAIVFQCLHVLAGSVGMFVLARQ